MRGGEERWNKEKKELKVNVTSRGFLPSNREFDLIKGGKERRGKENTESGRNMGDL